jgi:DNA-binding transcriptional ArsR family regulator
VTKHLNVLEEAGLVASNRIGRESRYSFRPEAIKEIRAYLDEVSRQWDDALGRLKSFVEG